MIRKCVCKHEFQDRRYGKCNRVANPAQKPGGGVVPRCTVCGKLIVGSSKVK